MPVIHLYAPAEFGGLKDSLESLDDELSTVEVADWNELRSLVDHSSAEASRLTAVAVVGARPESSDFLTTLAEDLDSWKKVCALDLVLIVSDEAIGTDAALVNAGLSAGVIALVRSVAMYRGTKVRVNAIVGASHLFGGTSSQRGPLPPATWLDVANAAHFLAGEQAGYVSGQVLYVNSGRQIFSSLTA